MNTIIGTLNNLPMPKYAFGNVSEKQIREAESKLNLTFADEFRTFSQYVGALVYKENEIYGVVPYPALDTVDATIRARQSDVSFPQNMYVVSSLHIDGVLILQNVKGEIFQYIPLQLTKKIFDSLSAYIKSL